MLQNKQIDFPTDQTNDDPLAQQLLSAWNATLAGDEQVRHEWHIDEGEGWSWANDGAHAHNKGIAWSSLVWQRCDTNALQMLKNFVVEVTINGKAEAAGFSFGPYKDFLAPLEPTMGTRHLQLQVHASAGWWAFRIDGQLMERVWWDAAIHTTEDIINGIFTLKGKQIEELCVQSFSIHTFEVPCQVSIILTCHRFLQRLRVSLYNWCNQDAPLGTHEVLVAHPESQDGTHEYLSAVASSYPHMSIREVITKPPLTMSKGKMINQAIAASQGEWIWLADADMIFPPTAIAHLLSQINGQTQYLFYCQRSYLTASQTSALLSGRINALTAFEALAQASNPRSPDCAPWGYTQIVHRSVIERILYRDYFNHFANCDLLFVDDCKRHNIEPRHVDGLIGLHLDHPFSWYGTNTFL
jgi:Glycosyl transferase family 2